MGGKVSGTDSAEKRWQRFLTPFLCFSLLTPFLCPVQLNKDGQSGKVTLDSLDLKSVKEVEFKSLDELEKILLDNKRYWVGVERLDK